MGFTDLETFEHWDREGIDELHAWRHLATYLEKKFDINVNDENDLVALIAEWGYKLILLRHAQGHALTPLFQSDARIDRLKEEYPYTSPV